MFGFLQRLTKNTKVGVSEVTHGLPIIYAELKELKASLTIILDVLEDILDDNTDVEL